MEFGVTKGEMFNLSKQYKKNFKVDVNDLDFDFLSLSDHVKNVYEKFDTINDTMVKQGEEYFNKNGVQDYVELGGVYHHIFRDLNAKRGDLNEGSKKFVIIIPKYSKIKKMNIIDSVKTWSNEHPINILHSIFELTEEMGIKPEEFPVKYLSMFEDTVLRFKNKFKDNYITYKFDNDSKMLNLVCYEYHKECKKYYSTFSISLSYDFLSSALKDSINDSPLMAFYIFQEVYSSQLANYIKAVDKDYIIKIEELFDDIVSGNEVLVSDYYYYGLISSLINNASKYRSMITHNDKDNEDGYINTVSIKSSLINDIADQILFFLYVSILTKYEIENRNRIIISDDVTMQRTIKEDKSEIVEIPIIRTEIKLDKDLIITTNDQDTVTRIKERRFNYKEVK